MEKLTIKEFFKTLIAQKGMSIKDLAEASGKSGANVSTILSKGKISMVTFEQFMNACSEDITIVLSNGNKHTLTINK